MTLPAWRPLKDAPRDKPVAINYDGFTRVAQYHYGEGWGYWSRGWVTVYEESGATFVPIADTYELDRAVQGEIARAFGALIQAMVDAEYYLSLRGPNSSYDLIYADNADGTFRAGTRAFRGILHTAMGGRIPDEVPHAEYDPDPDVMSDPYR